MVGIVGCGLVALLGVVEEELLCVPIELGAVVVDSLLA